MDKQTQVAIAGAIYGIIGLLFLCAFGLAVYAAGTTGKEAFIPMSALFGIIAFASIYASTYAFTQANQQ